MNEATNLNPTLILRRAVIGGVIGGVLFGIMMAMNNMLPMVAGLIRNNSPIVGFIVHIVISIGLAVPYAVLEKRFSNSNWLIIAVVGAIYGVIWWVLGALILMPLMLEMGEMVMVVGAMQIQSLIGHIVYGVALTVALKAIK